jgi:hypothetical protein
MHISSTSDELLDKLALLVHGREVECCGAIVPVNAPKEIT